MNPGTELGRYTLDAQIETVSGGERWAARDTMLERDVTLLVMPADDTETAAALDAARRAAGVESAQLVRILDVGTQGSLAYVCEEQVEDPTTFATLIGTKGVPAEEVRRITGEVATGLEAARMRGLHHLALTPESVLLTKDGRIKVRGLATTAALAGTETEGEDADRDDATGVVALAYAGLTATWPLETPSGVPAARRGEDGPPPPSRIAVGVPGDLDTICRETLGEGTGPDSPGDYAAQVAPWSRMPLAGSVRTTPLTRAAATDLPDQRVGPGPGPDAATADSSSGTPAVGAAAAGAAVAGGATAAAGAANPSGGRSTTEADDDTDTNEIPQYRDDASPATAGDTTGGSDRSDTEGAAGGTARAAAAAGAVGTGAKVLGDRLGKASKTAAERSREALNESRARRDAIREDRSRHSSLGAAPVSAEVEAPAPLLPAESGQAPTRAQSNLVLLIVAAFVVVACVFGGIGAAQIGDGSDLDEIFVGDGSTPTQTDPTDGSTSADSGSKDSSSSDEPNDEPFGILNAAGYDPSGDGVEHNAEAARVYDGDPDTVWTTEGYATQDFGGGKTGVGLAVDLGQSQEISTVTLELPTSADATVFAGDAPSNSGTEIGTTEGQTGEVTLSTSDPVSGRYITVWFTSLTPDGEGRYRASLGEITIK
ncbi:hypothetical protein [Janibacter cremeus]|uniref:Protein kinase domain-containing protein n=1 Tax=Janibacter cremeus TaxID=1285192 RepID=A0A852VVC9_9MICO|nr:hypothetical protein [Janibacter cremeus]NYF98244.1 hypothetical protein [Janibacter cremeus]